LHYIIALLLSFAVPTVDHGTDEKIPLRAAQAEALVDSIGREYYEAKFALYPAYATAKGAHRFDADLSMFAPRQVNAYIRRTRRLEQTLNSFYEDSLSMQAWIDLKALSADMATEIFILTELDMWHRSPRMYSDACIDGIYYLLIRPGEEGVVEAVEARLSKVPDVVAQARRNLNDPIRLHCEVASTNLKDFAVFLEGGLEHGADIDGALIRQAVAALTGFAAYLDSLAPMADPAFSLGRENLITLLRTRHLIELPPESLTSYAEEVLADTQALVKEAARRSPVGVDADETAGPGPGGLTKDDIITYMYAEIESARAFVRTRDLVTLPDDEELRVAETPAFLRSLIPGYAYMPAAPLDESQTGFFYAPLPAVLDAGTRARYGASIRERQLGPVVSHEAFPGHHVQITRANRLPSHIRRLQENMFTIEGWAFYCEELMAQEGYYGTDGMDRVLGGIVFRACRVIVDIKLQTGEFSLDEAVDFMVRQTGGSKDFMAREVRRYAVEPTQAMSYLIGKREIMELRKEVRNTMGEPFSLKAFHDLVLSCGSLPPQLLKTCVISKTVGRQ
jgi:uncharacterized protein (DUF885 family)